MKNLNNTAPILESSARTPVEFYVIELALLPEGVFHITLTGTRVDCEQELLMQKITRVMATSLDDALAAIQKGVIEFGPDS